MQTRLRATGSYAIMDALSVFGVADRVHWPRALEGAAFMYDKKQRRSWSATQVAMGARYAMFVPEAIVPIWDQLAAPTTSSRR